MNTFKLLYSNSNYKNYYILNNGRGIILLSNVNYFYKYFFYKFSICFFLFVYNSTCRSRKKTVQITTNKNL